ncbi:sec-independent protein translocase protein TatA [Altererythrobacter atlanticus]|uniref:Sec-independent protein translocase protein TatA n=1 Tax=Croceibacterium atlanticum TaxID=1267766 RepID=A0A0F7KTG3_9SPHN|nr:twin-arginine translocase TatA/TatE family subunit [Croceibacterium atlanticum]AKH42426.1 Sec-independent protein translocase protein TatA [Croceibacterium atlanticum]MBB5731203.1 sec-independent protein translocase protein TatA [Croceibacterium atlanticum]
MNIGPFQILIIALVILVLFGRGRISEMMGDFGKGVKSFRQGLSEEEKAKAETEAGRIEGPQHEAKPANETIVDSQPAADKTVN